MNTKHVLLDCQYSIKHFEQIASLGAQLIEDKQR